MEIGWNHILVRNFDFEFFLHKADQPNEGLLEPA
jgi:hypothetical protein